jgi:hypothetical protein
MKKNINISVIAACSILLFVGCTYKSKAIVDPKFGNYNFTTYTIDTFRLKVILNNSVLTDSLPSPWGNFSKSVSFFDSAAHLLIINTANNQIIADSVFKLRTGDNNISIVQFIPHQTPYILPKPDEQAPPAGSYKIRFQYTPFRGDALNSPQPFFYDSVTCIVKKNGVEIDTVVLKHYDVTPYYQGVGNGSTQFSVRIENPVNGNVIDPFTDPVGSNYIGFNTVSVSGRAAVDDWKLIRVY